jgi:hypothetical protein
MLEHMVQKTLGKFCTTTLVLMKERHMSDMLYNMYRTSIAVQGLFPYRHHIL